MASDVVVYWTPIASRKIFTRAGVCKVELLLRSDASSRGKHAYVWEPFGKYYYALGAITVVPANPQE
jgi:hypothetical protein